MSRRRRKLLFALFLSLAIHALLIALLFPIFLRKWQAGEPAKEPVVAMSVIRMEHRTPASPTPAPKPSQAPPRASPARRPTRSAPRAARLPRRELTNNHHVAPPRATSISAAVLAQQQVAFVRTIAQAKAAQDPVAGSQSAVVPEQTKHYGFNASSISTVPSAGQGYLSPIRRWIDGDLVYYYVRYSVTYPDGTFETGIVPWPIHYLVSEDPFARGIHSMPLPGPSADYAAASDTDMHPLVKNCYDNRYDYCPIAREGGGA